MKDRIVIPKDKIKVLTSCDCFPANGYFTFYKEDVEIEQVPESWEELKELCKKTGHYAVNILKGGLLNKEYIFIFGLSFRDNGDIEDIENNNVAENRTPAQMWNIIKNLIKEK